MPATSTPTTAIPGPGTPGTFPLRPLLALFTAAFGAVLTELLPAGLLPAMSAGLTVPQARIGYLVTGYAVASGLAAIPVTAALRGVRRRRVLIGLLLAFAVANTVTALSTTYPLTFAARLLAGAAGGTLWAMLAGYAARIASPEHRGRAIAVVLAGITVALALGIPAGTALAGAAGWRAVFGALAALALALVGWALADLPDLPGEPAAGRLPLRRIAAVPGIRRTLAVTLLLLLGHQAMYTYLAPYAAGAGLGGPGVLLLTFGVATVAGVWCGGALADRHLGAVLPGALALIAGALLVLGPAAGSPVLVAAAVACWGTAFGAAPTLLQTVLVDLAGPRRADPATALQATVYNLGIAGGSLTGGVVLARAGAGALPWVAAPLVGAALAVVLLGRRRAYPPRRTQRPRARTVERAAG
ncbi:MFS transporter [Kitasatospora sp. NPDC094015]|uniref:MFS transporter n=1 Tax=Kitasatospora sp. NPDC094015 TaxID=3155205 RepID=UPI00331FEB0A